MEQEHKPHTENVYSIQTLARFDHRPWPALREVDFLLLEVFRTTTQIPIIDFNYPGRYIAPQSVDDYSILHATTAHYRIMFDAYAHHGFTRPMPTRFDGATQVGIVDITLDPRIDSTNGLAVAGISGCELVIDSQAVTVAKITQIQGKQFHSPEQAKAALTYLKWRQLLIFYIEQIVYFFNAHNPTRQFDCIALTPHPHTERNGYDKNAEAARDSGMGRLTLTECEGSSAAFYIKPVTAIKPHPALQEFMEMTYADCWHLLLSKTAGITDPILRTRVVD